MKKIELVTVERLLYGIDDDINLVVGKMLGNLVPCSYRPTVALLQVGRTPGCVCKATYHDGLRLLSPGHMEVKRT